MVSYGGHFPVSSVGPSHEREMLEEVFSVRLISGVESVGRLIIDADTQVSFAGGCLLWVDIPCSCRTRLARCAEKFVG